MTEIVEEQLPEEGVDFNLIPTVNIEEKTASWRVRFEKGQYEGTVIEYGTVSINDTEESLTFDFSIVESPVEGIDVGDEQLQHDAGQILISLITVALEDVKLPEDTLDTTP